MHRGPYSRRNDTMPQERKRKERRIRSLPAQKTPQETLLRAQEQELYQHHNNHKNNNKNRPHSKRRTNRPLIYLSFIFLYKRYWRAVFRPILNLHRRSDTQFLGRFRTLGLFPHLCAGLMRAKIVRILRLLMWLFRRSFNRQCDSTIAGCSGARRQKKFYNPPGMGWVRYTSWWNNILGWGRPDLPHPCLIRGRWVARY